jgi:hypothetical protein
MQTNALPSEIAGVVAVIDPDAYSNAAYSTGWFDVSKFHSFVGIVLAGDLGSSATIDAKFEQATTDGGSPKNVTGRAITQLTQAGTDSNKQALINLRPDDLDMDNGYRWARLTVTVGTAASDMAALVLGVHPRNGLASDNDAATVDEIV